MSNFVELVGFDGEMINTSGSIIRKDGSTAPSWIDKAAGVRRCVLLRNGKPVHKNVHRLVADTFLKKPDGLAQLPPRALVVEFIDDDKTHCHLDNLKWTTNRALQLRSFLNRQEKALAAIQYPEFDETNPGIFPNAVECPLYPGYFFIPMSKSPIVISKTGEFINAATGRKHPCRKNHKGYTVTSLWDGFRYKAWMAHRLVGMLFCGIPERHVNLPFELLQINHIDGKKINNEYLNLEWVINSENMEHAVANRLVGVGSAVLSRCIHTGNVIKYGSVSELSRTTGIPLSSLFNHLNSMAAGRYADKDRVFKFDDASPWPDLLVQQSWNETKSWARYILVKNLNTDETFLFSTLAAACVELKLNLNALKFHRASHGTHLEYKGWLFVLSNKLSGEYSDGDIIS